MSDQQQPGTSERFSLSFRSSMLSEFRSSRGVLRGFEINHEFTSLGGVCNVLTSMPGVTFELRNSVWDARAPRFTYKGHLYEVSVPHADFWVGPVEDGVAYPETEELVNYIKRNLLAKLRPRLWSRTPRI